MSDIIFMHALQSFTSMKQFFQATKMLTSPSIWATVDYVMPQKKYIARIHEQTFTAIKSDNSAFEEQLAEMQVIYKKVYVGPILIELTHCFYCEQNIVCVAAAYRYSRSYGPTPQRSPWSGHTNAELRTTNTEGETV